MAPARRTFTVITTDDSGPGSLRQAIQENNLGGGGNTIVFSLPLAQTITLTTGELQIIQNVKIVGPGANQLALNGNLTNRIFGVYGYSPVYRTTVESTYLDTVSSTISGLRIENGKVVSYPGGGGIYVEAAITVSNCSFSNNSSDYGGAISNSGRLIVNNSTFNNNSANGDGGAIYNGGDLVVSRSTLANNSSVGNGGGIRNQGALTIIGSTFAGNSATASGGGIFYDHFANPNVLISDSTFSNNSSVGNGGGICSLDSGISRTNIVNSTFFDNTTASSGGGIYSESLLVLNNVTIAYNNASKGGGLGFGGFGQARSSNSIIAQNVASVGPDIFGRMLSFGYNLVGYVSGIFQFGFLTGDNSNGIILIRTGIAGDVWSIDASNRIDPLLGPIGNHGGLTQTMPLLPGSPALDAGSNILAVDVAGTPLTVDQRGSQRVVNGTVDKGAFESRASDVISAISAPLDGFQGVSSQTRSFALSATDPSLAPANVSSYVVNWGDGTRLQAYTAVLNGATAQHAFPTAGSYTISVSALDASGDITVPTTRTITIFSTESQGRVFAVGGTSAQDASADDTLTLTLVTATTATLKHNTTNLGTFDQSVHSEGVHFFGGSGNDTVIVMGTAAADMFTVTQSSVAGNTIVLQGQNIEQWNINALAGDDTITIISGTPIVDGGTGTDKIIAADVANLWTISSLNTGTLNDQSFSRIENLIGGTDDDVFQYIGTGSLGGTIDGGLGLGNNTLDYSQRPTKVNVSLLNSTASSTGGIANLKYFIGSQASDDRLTAPTTSNTGQYLEIASVISTVSLRSTVSSH